EGDVQGRIVDRQDRVAGSIRVERGNGERSKIGEREGGDLAPVRRPVGTTAVAQDLLGVAPVGIGDKNSAITLAPVERDLPVHPRNNLRLQLSRSPGSGRGGGGVVPRAAGQEGGRQQCRSGQCQGSHRQILQ